MTTIIPASPAYTSVIATANGQTAFDFDFLANQSADLQAVYYPLDNGTPVTLAGGVDFTITAGAGDPDGGTITLTDGSFVQETAELTILRRVVIERSADYQRDLYSSDLNGEQGKIFQILQQLARDVDSALKVTPGQEIPTVDFLLTQINAAIDAAAAAAASEVDAEAAAASAEADAIAAGNSASAAAASQSAAGTSATNAAASASAASGSATSAGNSASAAATSAGNASTSATNAAASASAAAGSATAADASADAAAADAAALAATGIGKDTAPRQVTDLDDINFVTGPAWATTTATGTWAAGPGQVSLNFIRYSGTAGRVIKIYVSGAMAGMSFERIMAADVWDDWKPIVNALNLRNPPSEITTPLMHFERSIPLNSWECGVRGHDTNPTVDESAAILAMLTKARSERRDIAWQATQYLCGQINIAEQFELRMYGVGGKPIIRPTAALLAAGGNIFNFSPGQADASYLSFGTLAAVDLVPGATSIVLPASWGGTVGECYVGLTSSALWYHDHRNQWRKGELHRVIRTSGGTTLVFEDMLFDAYDSTETINYRVFKASRLEMANMAFGNPEWSSPDNGSGLASGVGALRVDRTRNAVYEDLEFHQLAGSHLTQRNTDGTKARGLRFWGGGESGDTGYGMAHLACKNAYYEDIQGGGMRRLVDFSGTSGTTASMGPSRNCEVNGFHVWGGAARDSANVIFQPQGSKESFGVGTHGPAENITFRNGKITGVGSGITVRGRNTIIDNVRFYGRISDECISLTYGAGVKITNCEYDSNDYGDRDAQGVTINTGYRCNDFVKVGLPSVNDGDGLPSRFNWDELPTIIRHNRFDGLKRSFMRIEAGQDIALRNGQIIDNVGRHGATSGTFFMFDIAAPTPDAARNVNVYDSDIWGNEAHPRPDATVGAEWDDSTNANPKTLLIGLRDTPSLSQDRVSRTGPKTYRLQISNDSYQRIKCMDPYSSGATHRRIMITCVGSSDPTIFFDGWLLESSPTPVVIHQGSNLDVYSPASGLQGATGTAGKMTIGLGPNGMVAVENRRGATRVVDVTFF